MGLVFVLLLGEIDLSAGTASGVTASVMALHLIHGGNLLGGMGDGVFYVFCGWLVLAVGLSLLMRIWTGAVLSGHRAGHRSARRARERVDRACCSRSASARRSAASPATWSRRSASRRSS